MRKRVLFILAVAVMTVMAAFLYGCEKKAEKGPAYEITLSEYRITLAPDAETQLFAYITPDDGTQAVVWQSGSDRIVAVDGNGLVRGLATGTGTVIAMLESDMSVAAVCEVRVAQPVQGVRIENGDTPLEIAKGSPEAPSTATLKYEIFPSNAGTKTVDWSVSPAGIVSVSGGVVTALKGGEATVTVKTRDGGFEASRVIKVIAPAEGIEFETAALKLAKGTGAELKASVMPADATDKTVTYSSSNPAVAAVDSETGEVTAVDNGSAVITAASGAGGFEAECAVTVYTAAVSVALDETALTATIDKDGVTDILTLTASFTDGAEVHTEKVSSWSSNDENIAVVEKDGETGALITPKGRGTAVITVETESGLKAECEVTVTVKVREIELNKERIDLFVGEGQNTDTLTVVSVNPSDTAYGANDTGYTMALANPSDSEFIDFNASTGAIKAIKNNIDGVKIIVTALDGGGAEAACFVYVKVAATGIEAVNAPEKHLSLRIEGDGSKESVALEMKILPEGEASSMILWETANPSVASVSDGVVTAQGGGDTVIKASLEENPSIFLEITVSVTRIASSVVIEEGGEIYVILEEDESETTLQLHAAVLPDGDYGASLKAVEWTSNNPDAASVDQNGLVTIQNGTAVIVATALDGGGAFAEITVRASKRPVGVEIWGTIDDYGYVYQSGGSAPVNRYLDGAVTPRISLNGGAPLNQIALSARVLPAEAVPTVEWFSYDESIVTVDPKTGVVTAAGIGKGSIGVRTADGMNEDDVEIEVYSSPTDAEIYYMGVGVTNKEIRVSAETRFALELVLLPESSNEADINNQSIVVDITKNGTTDESAVFPFSQNNVVWTFGTSPLSEFSDSETVDITFYIITTSFPDGFFCSVRVTVVSGVNVVQIHDQESGGQPVSQLTLKRNENKRLYAVIFPANADNKSVEWVVTDPSVVSVTQTGVIKGISKGIAQVRAVSKDNGRVFGSCFITVYEPTDKLEIQFMGGRVSTVFLLTAPKTQFGYRVTPSGADENGVEWRVEDPLVASVDQSGLVTAHNSGSTRLIINAKDDPSKEASILLEVGFDAKEGDFKSDVRIMQAGSLSSTDPGQSYISLTIDDKALNPATGAPYNYKLFYSFEASCDTKTKLIEGTRLGTARVYRNPGTAADRIFTAGTHYLQLLAPAGKTAGTFVVVETSADPANITDDLRAGTLISKQWTAFTTPVSGVTTWAQLKTALASGSSDITLAANIDAKGEAYNCGSTVFNAVFDGRGFIVFNLNITGKGLYSAAGNATVKDVIFANPKVNTSQSDSGFLFGTMTSATLNVENVKIINIDFTSVARSGVILGVKKHDAKVYVKNVEITGKLNTGSYSGGVVGISEGDRSPLSVENSRIDITASSGGMFGAVIGHCMYTTGAVSVKTSYIRAVIQSTGPNVGGVIGYADNWSQTTVSGCDVIVTIDRGAAGHGGVAGTVNNWAKVTVENCNVQTTFTSSGTGTCGIVVGQKNGGNASDAAVYNSSLKSNMPAYMAQVGVISYVYVEGGTSAPAALADFAAAANNALYSSTYISDSDGITVSESAGAYGYQLWKYEGGALTFLGGYEWWLRVAGEGV